ncbi:hypothetical protein Asp14428_14990 [Actinoplanes sp. NBRC 14428]|nr:hypothetical protein Asp14428_14990 [Actinoplanes sp. NBRC 14428]
MYLRRTITLGLATAAAFAGALTLSAGAAQASAPAVQVAGIGAVNFADSGPWPIVDQNGVERSTLSINWETGNAIACYGGEAGDVRIELKFESGYVQQRVVPQFGCAVTTPAGAPADAGRPVAVRGLVGSFANPWHENA